jgi:hypothetical protein
MGYDVFKVVFRSEIQRSSSQNWTVVEPGSAAAPSLASLGEPPNR